MISSVLSTTFGYVDIAILVLLGLGLIIGLIRGFAKSLHGFFLSVATVLISLLLLGVTFAPIRVTPVCGQLETALSGASTTWGPAFNDEIFKVSDQFFAMEGGQLVELKSLDGIKGKIADLLAKQFYVADGQSVAQIVTGNLTSLIIAIILFIAYCIGFGLIFAIFRHLTKGLHKSLSTPAKVVDRIGGGIVATALAFMLVLLLLAIFSALQNKIPQVIDYIQNSTIGKFFYDLNPIGKVFEQIFVK
ncbi:MAG: hypothetical protein RR405_01660 [Clostridia bacterium]